MTVTPNYRYSMDQGSHIYHYIYSSKSSTFSEQMVTSPSSLLKHAGAPNPSEGNLPHYSNLTQPYVNFHPLVPI